MKEGEGKVESELRRKAMESMLKNKKAKHGQPSEEPKMDDDQTQSTRRPSVELEDREDGELDDDIKGSHDVKESVVDYDDEDFGKERKRSALGGVDPPDKVSAGDIDMADSRHAKPRHIPPPPPLPADGTPTATEATLQKKKSKWAEDDSEDESDSVAPAAIPANVPRISTPLAGKSKWADASPSPPPKDSSAKELASSKDMDFLSKATAAGDSIAALDMLEDRLRARGNAEQQQQQQQEGAPTGEGDVAESTFDDTPLGAEGDAAAAADSSMMQTAGAEPGKKKLNRCRDVDKSYQKLNKIDEGTYGVVYRAKCRITDRIVALKQVKLERAKEGFPLTALRELTVLLALRHHNIVDVDEVVVSQKKQVFMVMEYMEHDFKSLMESMHRPFRTSEVKCLMHQLLSGTEFMHRHWVIHRDLKTSNLLMDNAGNLKICDFGLARLYQDPIKPMTAEVVTLWYRAPELLYGEKNYTIAIDMWSIGCIFGELVLKEPLLKGRSEQEMRDKIVELMGTPDEENWPNFKNLAGSKNVRYKKRTCQLREKIPKVSYTGGPSLSDAGYEMLIKMLCYDPEQRLTARAALDVSADGWFSEPPHPLRPQDMPTFPSQHEQPKGAKKRARSPEDKDAKIDFYDDDKRFNRKD